MVLKMEVSLGKWLLTNKVKHLVWERKSLKEVKGELATDVFLHKDYKEIFYEKEDSKVRKDRDELLEHVIAVVRYTDEDDNSIYVISSYAVYVLNDDGKTIERIN